MSRHFDTPAQAVGAMTTAGASFKVRRRGDGLGWSFTYSVGPDGDLKRCREILAVVKAKPSQFFEGFKLAVAKSAGGET